MTQLADSYLERFMHICLPQFLIDVKKFVYHQWFSHNGATAAANVTSNKENSKEEIEWSNGWSTSQEKQLKESSEQRPGAETKL